MNEEEKLNRSRKFYLRLLVIGLFAFALLHSIHPFFFRFLFWISFGMGAMALYYHIALKIAQRGSFQFRTQGQQKKWAQSQSPSTTLESKAKKAVITVFVVVFFVFFLLILIGIFIPSDQDLESMTLEVKDPVIYNQAKSQYDEQNYRGAINTLQTGFGNETVDTQSVLLLGDSYYGLEQLDSAYVWYAEAYSRGERNAYLSHVMAYILDKQGNTHEAIILYKEAVSMDSTKADVFRRLAELEPENASFYQAKQRAAENLN
jgi:tetratricopeptide (TPR) repeat protein